MIILSIRKLIYHKIFVTNINSDKDLIMEAKYQKLLQDYALAVSDRNKLENRVDELLKSSNKKQNDPTSNNQPSRLIRWLCNNRNNNKLYI